MNAGFQHPRGLALFKGIKVKAFGYFCTFSFLQKCALGGASRALSSCCVGH